MVEWEDVRRWVEQEPAWVPYAAISSAATLLLCVLVCIFRLTCCRRGRSNYEAINKDLEMEEREFALGLSSDEEGSVLDGGREVEFNDDEYKQMEMLEAFGHHVDETMAPTEPPEPLSPSAATTSHRTKKTLGDN
ncbi:Aste57867_16033 [Aphanomyces stellatus]|uniref:Aste57867_16033 protein n=1 Tax=Aphanomyces stellatus TaxID=120398 RepID=A0A485L4I4_9STRA|nr:hypothetical protein As57867_015977 [Aphanomyces stellatus]VFT92818.1 Aste57867_16033 [Aphanomyces stellatus]